MRLITLTTDFGYQDGFAGVLHGVMLSRLPSARIVDVTHGVPRGDVRAAAFVLASSIDYFPPDSIHVVVVDPGVGSERSPLAIRRGRGFLVGPDNGVFGRVLSGSVRWAARRIEHPKARLPEVSATFHGRDIFAPAAAWLAGGGRFDRLGPRVAKPKLMPWTDPVAERDGWRGEVVYVDRFGNATTNLPNALLADPPGAQWRVRLPGRRSCPVGPCYAAVVPGRPVVVPGSDGLLEIAVNQGNAAAELGLGVGLSIGLRRIGANRQ